MRIVVASPMAAECAAGCCVTVHAYCWLQAEARLAVQIADVPIGQFAQRIAEQYAPRLEQELSLTGSHFEQKYRGVLVDGQTALLDLVRHIHLAPVRAGLTDDLLDYRWCSHRTYMGLEEAPWLTTKAALEYFAQSGADARSGYAKFMEQGLDQLDSLPAPARTAAPKGSRQRGASRRERQEK
jgi:hypothetical protein